MKKFYIIFSIFFSVFIFSSCSYGQKEYECIYCDGVNPGIQYKCNGYSYWYFKQVDSDYVECEIKTTLEYSIVSSYEEAEKHDTYDNVINELCANNSSTFYNRNKLLIFYLTDRKFNGIYSIVMDNNKLVVMVKTSSSLAEVHMSRCVIKLSNFEYKKIDEIIILEVDSNGNDIAILY